MNGLKTLMGYQEPPPPPDYTGAAKATAAGNLETAKYATAANRANQYTPYGSLIWRPGATDADPWTQIIHLSGVGQQLLDADNQSALGLASLQNQVGSRVADAQRAGWNDKGLSGPGQALSQGILRPGGLFDVDGMRQGMSLDPSRVKTGNVFDQNSLSPTSRADMSQISRPDALNQRMATGGGNSLQASPFAFQSRNVDNSNVGDNTSYYDPSKVGNIGSVYNPQSDTNAATQAILSRVNPQLDRRRQSTEAQLINQGITRGSEAWRNAQTDLGQAENDAFTQAGLQGINLGLNQQGQTYGQTMSNRGALSQDQQILANQQQAGRAQSMNQALANMNNQQTNASRALSADQASANMNLGAQQQAFNQNLANSNQAIGAQNQAFTQNQLNNDQYLRANQQLFGQTQAGDALRMQANNQAFDQTQGNNNAYLQMQNQAFGQNATTNAQNMAGQQQQFGQNQANNAQTMAANLQAFNQNNALRASGLQEQNYFANRDLNQLNALRTGSQVTNPTFGNYAQQQYTPGADYLGAANAGYNAQMGATNANNAFSSDFMKGLFGIGAAAAGKK